MRPRVRIFYLFVLIWFMRICQTPNAVFECSEHIFLFCFEYDKTFKVIVWSCRHCAMSQERWAHVSSPTFSSFFFFINIEKFVKLIKSLMEMYEYEWKRKRKRNSNLICRRLFHFFYTISYNLSVTLYVWMWFSLFCFIPSFLLLIQFQHIFSICLRNETWVFSLRKVRLFMSSNECYFNLNLTNEIHLCDTWVVCHIT